MNCKDCKYSCRGFFKSRPNAYVCIGTREPFVIDDRTVSKCNYYKEDERKVDEAVTFPKQFEYVDILRFSDREFESPKYVTILDDFAHHYTGDKFYHIRIEYNSYIFEDHPVVEYETVDEKKLREMYSKCKEV